MSKESSSDLACVQVCLEAASIPSSLLKASPIMNVNNYSPAQSIAPTPMRPTGGGSGSAAGNSAKPDLPSLPLEQATPPTLPSNGLVGTRINTSA
jgi:hypothetical protein